MNEDILKMYKYDNKIRIAIKSSLDDMSLSERQLMAKDIRIAFNKWIDFWAVGADGKYKEVA